MIPKTKPHICIHFGCIERSGHRASTHDKSSVGYDFCRWIENMDGQLHTEAHDRWLTHHFQAAGISVDAAIKLFGKRGLTRTKDMVTAYLER